MLRALPVTQPFQAGLAYGGQTPSSLSLPLAPAPRPSLSASWPALNPGDLPDLRLSLQSFSQTPGWRYQILAGYSGVSPGVVVRGTHLEINPDPLTLDLWQNPGQYPVSSFDGVLDLSSRATAEALLSHLPPLPGGLTELDFLAVVLGPGGMIQVSAPLRLGLSQ